MKRNKIGEGIGGTNPHIARSKFLYCLTTVYFCLELPVPVLPDIAWEPTSLLPLSPHPSTADVQVTQNEWGNHEPFSASSIQQKEKYIYISGFCWNQWRRSEVVRFQAAHPIFQGRKSKAKVAIWQGCGWLHLTPCKASGSNTWLPYLGHSQDWHTSHSEANWGLLSERMISKCIEVFGSTNSA